MIIDFLSTCSCALVEETADFQAALRALQKNQICIGFMPAITDDIYPVFALACTSAREIISPNFYIIPVGAHEYWAKPYFEELVNKFYEEDYIREQFQIELEETLLLKSPICSDFFSLNGEIQYNVLFCHLTMPNGSTVYLCVVPSTPKDCWNEIIETYRVKCDIVIDSHKGMGDWFECVPLYQIMRETESIDLLPRHYFKGLYISHDAPQGFNLIYTIPETITCQGRIVDDWQKEIYEIDWRENKKC